VSVGPLEFAPTIAPVSGLGEREHNEE
jgi:hypothetical protein